MNTLFPQRLKLKTSTISASRKSRTSCSKLNAMGKARAAAALDLAGRWSPEVQLVRGWCNGNRANECGSAFRGAIGSIAFARAMDDLVRVGPTSTELSA